MLYFALTFWLLVIVFTSWGVHQLWSDLIKPKALNALLLPGTLVAISGHLLGLLITGATVSQATLFKDDDSGDPETTTDAKPRIPVLGPIIIGLFPLLFCGAAIYAAAKYLGAPLLNQLPTNYVERSLPLSLGGIFDLLRNQFSLVEALIRALFTLNYRDWRVGVFLYLLLCLALRIRPFAGTARGALGAIILVGVAAAAISSFFDISDPRVQAGWSVLNLLVATLLLLLFATLIVRGAIGLVQVLRSNA